jgi:hypothetical protein
MTISTNVEKELTMSFKGAARQVVAMLVLGFSFLGCGLISVVADDGPAGAHTVAFLGVQLQNDNEGLEPTTDAERSRMKEIGQLFETKLEASGRYKFVAVPSEMSKEIAAGQNIGECHGCEVEYGRKLHADLIAWIKVSNLILNMNVY